MVHSTISYLLATPESFLNKNLRSSLGRLALALILCKMYNI